MEDLSSKREYLALTVFSLAGNRRLVLITAGVLLQANSRLEKLPISNRKVRHRYRRADASEVQAKGSAWGGSMF